jgi:hypothetical protein
LVVLVLERTAVTMLVGNFLPFPNRLFITQSTTLQQQQQLYPVTPEDGQLGRNM